MISLKRYFSTQSTEATLRQMVALFLKKFSESAVACDPHELEVFRNEINALHDRLTPDLPMDDLLIATGAATQALETYNKRIMRIIGNQSRDFQEILKLLQAHLAKMTGANSNSVDNLNKIGEELGRFRSFKDVEPLKLHLDLCLSGLRDEIEREKSASKELIEKLQIDMEGFRGPNQGLPDSDRPQPGSDRVTGCVAAIQAAIMKGTRHYVAVMVVNRVQQTNARFGMVAGDLMLSRFKEMLECSIAASDQLFRWKGPAMVAILERPQPLSVIRLLVKQMVGARTEVTFELGGRSVLIPISANWSVFPLEATPSATADQINGFIASQGSHDFS